MIPTAPRDALDVAHERGRRLRAEAAAERLRGTSVPCGILAAVLRRAADRLDPAPLARSAALGPGAGTPLGNGSS